MRMGSFLRCAALVSALVLCVLPALAQAAPDQGGLPSFNRAGDSQDLQLTIQTGLAVHSSRGGIWALEPGLGLDASLSRGTHATIRYSQAYGSFDGSGAPRYRPLESASLSIGWQSPARGWARFDFSAFTRYQSLGSAGDEARFGGIATALASPLAEGSAFSISASAGYSQLMLRPAGMGGVTWTQDPLVALGLDWQGSDMLRLGVRVSDYHDVDADLEHDTFIALHAETKLRDASSRDPALADFGAIFVLNDLFGDRAILSGVDLELSLRFPLADNSLHAGIGSE